MFCSFSHCYMYAAWLMLCFSALSFLLHTVWLLVWSTGMMTVHFTLLHSLLYKMIQMVWTTCITSRPAFFVIWQCRYWLSNTSTLWQCRCNNTWSAIQHKHNEVITNSVIQTNIRDSCQYPVASPCSCLCEEELFAGDECIFYTSIHQLLPRNHEYLWLSLL